MDLPPLTEALDWLTTQPRGHPVGTRLAPRACLLALWLRTVWAAAEVSVDDQVVRVRWASDWRVTMPTPPAYARLIEVLDWRCGRGNALTISVYEARRAIEEVLREMAEERWNAPYEETSSDA